MKIVDVEAIILRQPDVDPTIADGSQDDLLIRVITDEGIVGIGEVDSSPEVAKAVVEAPGSNAIASGLKSVLVGEDPFAIETLWEKMYRASIFYGRRGPAIHAISGIDIALWDIKGKALGLPIYRLMGGPVRDRIRAYASTLMPNTEAEVEAKVARFVEMGFTAIKLGWGPQGQDPAHDVKLAKAARRAAGDDVDIMIDAGLCYDARTAIWVARHYEDLGIFWFEEPLMPDDYEGYAKLADTVEIPIAAGEEEATVYGFRELIERGHVDIVQPDVTRAGGLTECRRIAELARRSGRNWVPHAWKSGIIKAASLHLIGAVPDALFLEYCVAETPLNNRLTVQRFPLENGYVRVPQAPGLGVDLDEDVVRRYAVGPVAAR